MTLQPRTIDRDWDTIGATLGPWTLRRQFVARVDDDVNNLPFQPVRDGVRPDEGLPWGWSSDERGEDNDQLAIASQPAGPVNHNPGPWRRVNVTAENPLGEEAPAIADQAQEGTLSRRTGLYNNTDAQPWRISSTLAIGDEFGHETLVIIMDEAQKKMLSLASMYWPRLANKWFRGQAKNVGFSKAEIGGDGTQGWRNGGDFWDSWGFRVAYNGVSWEEFGRVLDGMAEVQSARYRVGWGNELFVCASKVDKVLEKAQEFFVVLKMDRMALDIRMWRDTVWAQAETVWEEIDSLGDYTEDRVTWDRHMKNGVSFMARQTLRDFATWVEELEARKLIAPMWEFEEPSEERLEILVAWRAWKVRKDKARVVDWNALGRALPQETIEELLLWATPVDGDRYYDSEEDAKLDDDDEEEEEDPLAIAPAPKKRKEGDDSDEEDDQGPAKKPKGNPAPKKRKSRDDDEEEDTAPAKKPKGPAGGSSKTTSAHNEDSDDEIEEEVVERPPKKRVTFGEGADDDDDYEPGRKKRKGKALGRPKKNAAPAQKKGAGVKSHGYMTRSRRGRS